MRMSIENKELKFLVLGTIIIILWFLKIRYFIAPLLTKINPFFAMLIYNIGFVLGGFLLATVLSDKKVRITIISFLIFLATDLITAPYLINVDGSLNTNVDYWFVSTDVGLGSFWQMLGIKGVLLWVFTYIITSILIILVLILVSKPSVILGRRK